MRSSSDHAPTTSASPADVAGGVYARTGDRWDGAPAGVDPDAMPYAWIGLLFALLVTVFTVAAVWEWLRP
jgi:hypothetical protein